MARLLMDLSSKSNLKKINSCHHFFRKVGSLVLYLFVHQLLGKRDQTGSHSSFRQLGRIQAARQGSVSQVGSEARIQEAWQDSGSQVGFRQLGRNQAARQDSGSQIGFRQLKEKEKERTKIAFIFWFQLYLVQGCIIRLDTLDALQFMENTQYEIND